MREYEKLIPHDTLLIGYKETPCKFDIDGKPLEFAIKPIRAFYIVVGGRKAGIVESSADYIVSMIDFELLPVTKEEYDKNFGVPLKYP